MATTRKTATRKPAARKSAAPRGAKTRATAASRDSHGRFKPDHHVRNAAFGATALVGAVAAGVAAAFKFGLLDRFLPAQEGHSAEDLLIDEDTRPDQLRRAPEAFRPNIDAPMTAAEREALRPPRGDAVRADAGEIEQV